jgi:CBS domain-containing protein
MSLQKTTPKLVEDLMTGDMLTVRAADGLEHARDLMLSLGIHALPVVAEDGKVVGIVTSHDLVDDQLSFEDGPIIEEIMTSPVVTISSEATLREAAEVMRGEFIHHLVVCDRSEPVGILSSFDLLKLIS